MVLLLNENAFSNKPRNQNRKPEHHRVTPSEKGNTKQKTNMKTAVRKKKKRRISRNSLNRKNPYG